MEKVGHGCFNITGTKHDDTQEIEVINRVGFNKSENQLHNIRAHYNATTARKFNCLSELSKLPIVKQ